MPRGIALIACILFIAALLRIESKQQTSTSVGLWVPLLWLLIAVSRPVSAWFISPGMEPPEIDLESGSPLDRAVASCLIGLGGFLLITRRLPWYSILKSNIWLAALILCMGLSILWSDFGEVSFKKWIRSIGVVVFALVVLTEKNPVGAVKRLLRRCMIIVIPLSILFIKYFPQFGVSYDYLDNATWVGVSAHKNSLGQLACVSAVFFLWNIMGAWKKKKGMLLADVVLFLMSLWLLKGAEGSTSKTSLLLFVIGALVMTGLQLLKRSPHKMGYITGAVLFMVFAAHLISNELFEAPLLNRIVETSGRNMTFTGRTELWQDVIDAASESPVAGMGFGSFWISSSAKELWKKYEWRPEAAHNGYIDVYVELGIIGLTLLSLLIVSSYRKILRELPMNGGFGRLQVTLFVLSVLYNITETSFLRPVGLMWILFVLVSLYVPVHNGICQRRPSEKAL